MTKATMSLDEVRECLRIYFNMTPEQRAEVDALNREHQEAKDKEAMAALGLHTDDRDASTIAFDEIASLCGCPGWEYPGQIVRDVRELVARLERTNRVAVEAGRRRDQLTNRITNALARITWFEEDGDNADELTWKQELRDILTGKETP